MTLSIVIVNWNSKDYVRECLLSIRQTCGDLSPQVIVVDGGSFDGCAEMLASGFTEVDFIQSPDNIGFGRSNNLGFTKATGDAVLLLNPDTVLRPGAVQELLRSLEETPGAGLIGARLLNTDGTLQYSSVHPLPTPWNVAFDTDWGRRRWWSRKGPPAESDVREVEAVSGACMMLRSETFRRLGGFDPRYFMYAEDMDLCFRIHGSGLKVFHAPRAVVVHHGGGSSGTRFSKFSTVMIREALDFYMLSNHGRGHSLLLHSLMALSALTRLPVMLAAWCVSSGKGKVAKACSVQKWWVVLKWSLGLEGWAKSHFGSQTTAGELQNAGPADIQSA